MPPIKSINAPREIPIDLGKDYGAPKILTSAIPEPPKPTTTFFTPERIIGMQVFENHLYIATENGVYVKDFRNYSADEAIFRRLKFEIVEEPNE